MREHEVNKLDNFIMGWYQDPEICDRIIDYFENDNHEKVKGKTSKGVDLTIKDSFDTTLDGDLRAEYLNYLQNCVHLYIQKYPYVNEFSPWACIEDIVIQKYNPGGGFYQYHTERGNPHYPDATRHMVFMTYLNDVTDGGETEFFHQGVKIKPEKGLTILWGTDWTFTHRGVASPTQTKYIATGWYNFVPFE